MYTKHNVQANVKKYTIRYIHCTLQRSIISTSHYLHFGKLTHLTSYNCIDVYQSHLDFCLYSMFEHLSALHLYCLSTGGRHGGELVLNNG